MYRIRIRTRLDQGEARWIIGGVRFSRRRADARVEELRRQGHVVHLDLVARLP